MVLAASGCVSGSIFVCPGCNVVCPGTRFVCLGDISVCPGAILYDRGAILCAQGAVLCAWEAFFVSREYTDIQLIASQLVFCCLCVLILISFW